MGRPAYQWSFQDIAGGALEELQPYDLIISTYSLHLLEKSYQHMALAALARSCRTLIVLSPHKKPEIEPSTGWRQVDELYQDRVRARLYISAGARRLEAGEEVDKSEHTLICEAPREELQQQAAGDEAEVDIKEVVSNMNTHELREALIKRGLSTDGKRSEWAVRLIEAAAKDTETGQVIEEAECDAGKAQEEEEQEETESEESESEYEESEEEEDSEEEEAASTSESEAEDAAVAAKLAAIKAVLAKRKQPKKTRSTAAAVAAKAKEEADAKVDAKKKAMQAAELKELREGSKVKETRVQSNFGQTKFIKP